MSGAASPVAEGDQAGSPHELMNRVYRRQRHVYDATRKYFLLGRDHLIAALNPPPGGAIIEIGCGTGRNLIEAARAYPDVMLYGLDVSTEMLSTARAGIRQAGLEHRVTLGLGDAARFDCWTLFRRVAFDRVFFSYSLSMIPAWREALRQGLAVAELAGGSLLVVDFGDQDGLPRWFRSLLLAWLARFHVTPRAELESVLGMLAISSGGRLVSQPLFRGYAHLLKLAR